MLLFEVVTQMYRMAGQLKGPGRGLSNSEQVEGLHILNSMLNGMRIERLLFYQIVRTVFATVIGQKDYVVGPLSSGVTVDWDIERPQRILRAGFIIPNGATPALQAEIPMSVFLSYEEYQRETLKDIGSTLPLVLYYRASLPAGTATLWPVPTAVGQVAIYTPSTVSEFIDIMDEFIVPDGYREFLEYAGAVAVHHRYPNNPMDPDVRQMAKDYKNRIKTNQFQPSFIRSDGAAIARTDRGYGTTWLDVKIGPGGGGFY